MSGPSESRPHPPEAFLEMWLKTSAEFWSAALKMLPDAAETSGTDASSSGMPRSTAVESWEASFKTWRAVAALMAEPAAAESIAKGITGFPEIASRMFKPIWEGVFHLQREWMERAGRIGKSTAAYKFEDLDKDVFKVWRELYEREFRQFLNIPQVGITRVYQERLNQATDRLTIFQAAMGEFISILCLPMEKSFKVLQEQLAVMADQGKLPEKSKDLYRMWVKILEGHYMTLFKSPEYTQALHRILEAMSDFYIARKKLVQDLFQSLPVPTQQDMDELSREIYLLKKRIKELEKKLPSYEADSTEA